MIWEALDIDVHTWFDQFTSLLNIKSDKFETQFYDYVTTGLETIEICSNANGALDGLITANEMNKCLSKLKHSKYCGIDSLSKAMKKYGGNALHDTLISVFNKVLASGKYPTSWESNIVSPIYISGLKTDPNNYRGIAISNCMAKLFSMIINIRLDNCLANNNIISIKQNGFKRGHRTEDNIYILQALYNKYKIPNSLLHL